MALQLEHVFAGVTVGGGEPEQKNLVDGLTLGVAQVHKGGVAGLRFAAQQALGQAKQASCAHAHNANGTLAAGRGDRHDGVMAIGQHG
jgi:hypothetical protein